MFEISSDGLPTVRGSPMIREPCVVLMPFTDKSSESVGLRPQFLSALEDLLSRALPGFTCSVCEVISGQVFEAISEQIRNARLVVCDLTCLRPNVVLELGMALTQYVPLLLLTRRGSEWIPPSDISNYAYVSYTFYPPDKLTIYDPLDGILDAESLGRHVARAIQDNAMLRENLSGPDLAIFNMLELQRTFAQLPAHRRRFLSHALEAFQENLIDRPLIELSELAKGDTKNATIRIRGPEVLFEMLFSLMRAAGNSSYYDSISWREHWVGPQRDAALAFLLKLKKYAHVLPRMRRIFLVGVTHYEPNSSQWVLDRADVAALKVYDVEVRHIKTLETRVLFLPQGLVATARDALHKGRLATQTDCYLITSDYDDETGMLASFCISSEDQDAWDFEGLFAYACSLSEVTRHLGTRKEARVGEGVIGDCLVTGIMGPELREPLRRVLLRAGVELGD